MAPSPIPPHVVSLLLQYISPLDGPLPTHLISKPLLQRHHFLRIAPEDLTSYLCWPSVKSDELERVASLLGALPSPEDADPLLTYPVRYSSDGEYVYAHVQITSTDRGSHGLRLVFQWDAQADGSFDDGSSWRYHDAKLMPFPSQSHASLEVSSLREIEVEDMSYTPIPDFAGDRAHNDDDDDDDDYWNAYGTQGDEDQSESHSSTMSHHSLSNEKTEDAYWAQYASVQGMYWTFI